MSRPTHVVFVTRKFPPAVGGMETLAEQTHRALLAAVDRVDLLALGRSQAHLVWWLPVTFVRLALRLARRPRPTHVLVGDALTFTVLAPLLRRVPTMVMVHGLDLTFDLPGYRPAIRRGLRRAEVVLANSRSTRRIALALGVDAERTIVVNPAVEAPRPTTQDRARAAGDLRQQLRLPPDAVLLLTVGRLVPRKGVGWVVENVLPSLPANTHYLVAGDGPAADDIQQTVDSTGQADRVHLLGRVSDDLRELLFQGSDVFVQANIPVDGDVEGFGLVTIEAAMRGTPVVASRLEGIEDAIEDGRTGWLCDPLDTRAFSDRISSVLSDPASVEHGRRFQEESHRRFSALGFPDRLHAALTGTSTPTAD